MTTLIERLRSVFGHGQNSLMRTAADELERQAKEIEALKADAERYRQELVNIATAKRHNRNFFEDDYQFGDWAQSRARFTLGDAIDAAIAQEEVK